MKDTASKPGEGASPAAPALLDLSDNIPLDSYWLEITSPRTGQPNGWKIHLAGPAHPLSEALSTDMGRENIARERARENAQTNGRKYKAPDATPDERWEKNVRVICRRIVGWEPNPVFKHIQADPIVFSLDTAVKLFMRSDMLWAFTQITEYFNSDQAFLTTSASS